MSSVACELGGDAAGGLLGKEVVGVDDRDQFRRVERATRIELAFSAWEADVLPLNYTRGGSDATKPAR